LHRRQSGLLHDLRGCIVNKAESTGGLSPLGELPRGSSPTLALVLISVVWMDSVPHGQLGHADHGANYSDVLSAFNKFVFANPGVLDEMAKPANSTRRSGSAARGPCQLAMYSNTSPTQYGYQGAAAASSGALIFEAVPTSNPLHGVCAFPAARARGTWHVAIA
jgi:hypothetical protein